MGYKPEYESYKQSRGRRRKVLGPLLYGIFAILIMAVGAFLIYLWVQGSESNLLSFLNTETPTFTITPTNPPPTDTPTITPTPTETPIPSDTPTQTASAPFNYLVESGDTLVTIADKFGVDYLTIMVLNGLTNDSILFVGDNLIIPNPAMEFPTPTPFDQRRGNKINYFVLPGDTIQIIAEKMLSDIDRIIDENDLEDPNAIYPGQILVVPYGLITPTFGPSATPEGFVPSETPTSTGLVTPTTTETTTP